MKIASVEQMRNMDRRAIETFGIRDELLMENAGLAAYAALCRETGVAGKTFVVLCGTGNNGGDGLVIARKILSGGGQASVFVLGDAGRFTGAAARNWEIVRRMPLTVCQQADPQAVSAALIQCDVIVDALLGTGLAREVRGAYREVIQAVNNSAKKVLSIDIPSGINGDTGQVMGAAIHAHITVTFGLPKLGNILYPGYAHCGRLYATHISFPPALYDDDDLKIETSPAIGLPPRAQNGHKGSFGKVLFIAGAAAYLGAPYFAARAFLKAGGGYARLAAPASIAPLIVSRAHELVMVPQQETTAGSIAAANREALLTLAGNMDMVVMGPGLSLDPETVGLVRDLAAAIDKPLLIDGDGITAVCTVPEIIRNRRAATIFTPHVGEMAKMADTTNAAIEADRIGALQAQTRRWQATIVLKGAHSLIAFANDRVQVNLSGNSGMATAGAGDVLSGTIAAMAGLGLPIDAAVTKGVFIHGLAGDLAAADLGKDGITATDILRYLPAALKADRRGLPARLRGRYHIKHLL